MPEVERRRLRSMRAWEDDGRYRFPTRCRPRDDVLAVGSGMTRPEILERGRAGVERHVWREATPDSRRRIKWSRRRLMT
jgi:hypothetical protein